MAGVAVGLTTLKAVAKLKRAIIPYYLQYNPKFETSNAKELRQELRSHPQVVGSIDRWLYKKEDSSIQNDDPALGNDDSSVGNDDRSL